MNLIQLSVGEPYPLPLMANEGAATQFLLDTGNILQIALPNLDECEKQTLKTGMIRAGMMYKNGAMLFIFQFYDRDNKPVLTFDAPFDIRLLPSDVRVIHTIENPEQRLAVEIHVVDTGILKVLRLVTMPHELTVKFLSAALEQLSEQNNGNKTMSSWMNQDLKKLVEKTKLVVMGT